MSAIIVTSPTVSRANGRVTVSSRIRLPEREIETWIRGPEDVIVPTGSDAFLLLSLTTAMARALPLVIEGTVSARLLAACETAQAIYHRWYPHLAKVAIEATPRDPTEPGPRRGTAAFFSGGVDSAYTAYKHQTVISALVLVYGFDVPLANTELRAKVGSKLTEMAANMGKRLVEIETNSRELTDGSVSWPDIQFGPALASVAVLLGGAVSDVLIPASESYAHLEPCGSHPLLDPLWSTEAIEIRHDGAEATRNEKVAAICSHPEVLRALRVCWENPSNHYNCGRCEKCLRTMINLETAGALDRCTAFEVKLDPELVAHMSIPFDLVFFHVEENLRVLRQQNRNPVLIQALEKAVARYEAQRFIRQLVSMPVRTWRYVLALLSEAARERVFGRRKTQQ